MKEYIVIHISSDREVCAILQTKEEILDELKSGWGGFGGNCQLVTARDLPSDDKPTPLERGDVLIIKGKCIAPTITVAELE